jgi:hypothetical protein
MMKKAELAENPSALSWSSVVRVLREGAPHGFTASEIAEHFGADWARARNLLILMFEAGDIARVKIGGKTGGTTLYFHFEVAYD